jgi:hypothetical protein
MWAGTKLGRKNDNSKLTILLLLDMLTYMDTGTYIENNQEIVVKSIIPVVVSLIS